MQLYYIIEKHDTEQIRFQYTEVTKFSIRCYRTAEGIEDDFHFVKVAD